MERKIEVEWARSASEAFPFKIVIPRTTASRHAGPTHLHPFDENANIRSLEAKTETEADGALVKMTADVRDKKHLEKLVAAMRRISGVRDVERMVN